MLCSDARMKSENGLEMLGFPSCHLPARCHILQHATQAELEWGQAEMQPRTMTLGEAAFIGSAKQIVVIRFALNDALCTKSQVSGGWGCDLSSGGCSISR